MIEEMLDAIPSGRNAPRSRNGTRSTRRKCRRHDAQIKTQGLQQTSLVLVKEMDEGFAILYLRTNK